MSVLRTILDDNDICFHPIDEELAEKIGLPYTKGCGYATEINSDSYIMYDAQATERERRYIIAHELGHIMLGHLNGSEVKNAEMEANIFAAVLTAMELYMEVYRR